MTGRAVPEWVGKTPDSRIPDHVKLRIWDRWDGRCHITGRKILSGDAWDYDHIIALCNWTGEGHGNRESNIAPALRDKHRGKTAKDVELKAESDRKRKSAIGIRSDRRKKIPARPFAKAPPQRRATEPLRKPAAWRGDFVDQ